MPLADLSHAELESLLVCLIVVALVAVFVFFGCQLAGRPDFGRIGAALVVLVGALLCLV